MLGLGADERRFGSRAQVNLAMGVPNVAGWPRSGARRNGVRHPSRTCGESSIPSLLNYSADLEFEEVNGMSYLPFLDIVRLTDDPSVNYIIHATKK